MPSGPVVVVDCETTGLSPAHGHRIVSLAVLPWPPATPGINLVFDPQRRCDPAAARVHGLSDSFLHGQPLFAAHADAVRDRLAGALVVGHNLGFDERFLIHELTRAGVAPPRFRLVCTMREYRRRHPGRPASLDKAALHYGLDISPRQAVHGAFVDAWIAGQLFSRMVLGVAPPPFPSLWPGFDNLRRESVEI